MAKTYKIAVVPGDGTGPEVIAEAVKVLKTAANKFKFKTDRSKAYRDGCARAAEICKRFDPEAK